MDIFVILCIFKNILIFCSSLIFICLCAQIYNAISHSCIHQCCTAIFDFESLCFLIHIPIPALDSIRDAIWAFHVTHLWKVAWWNVYSKSVDKNVGSRTCLYNDHRRACKSESWSSGNLYELGCGVKGRRVFVHAWDTQSIICNFITFRNNTLNDRNICLI